MTSNKISKKSFQKTHIIGNKNVILEGDWDTTIDSDLNYPRQ